jgi:hypothetical protein
MTRYIIDRFEDGRWAVLEAEGSRITVPREWLPAAVREGDVLKVTRHDEAGVSTVRFGIDPADRDARLGEVRRLRDLIPSGAKGDIAL